MKRKNLVTLVKTPGKFVPEGLQKIVFVEPDEVDGKVFLTHRKQHIFVNDLSP